MEFKELFFGVILKKDDQEYRFISHCFCNNNEDPEINLIDKDGKRIDVPFSKLIKEWTIKEV